jgi:hypothetical protein
VTALTIRVYNDAYVAFVRNHGFVNETVLMLANRWAMRVRMGCPAIKYSCDGCGNEVYCVTSGTDLVLVLHACCNGSNGGDPIC